MQKDALNNVHIADEQILITPQELKAKFPLTAAQEAQIAASRQTIADIIAGRDPRLLVVCGPCSIHDTEAALEYARQLQTLSAQLKDQLYIVMRVYFEKPRTTVGWKGLINDPYMNNSFDMEAGLHIARQLLVNLVEMGLPLATEALDPNISVICSAGLRLVPVLPSHKRTVRWLQVYRCLSASKTALMAASAPRSTPCALLRCRIVLSASIRRDRFACYRPRATQMAM